MQTKLTKINSKKVSLNELKEAVELLKKGEIVVFPTETVYGLGANAFNENAVAKIFQAKNRQPDNPLIVHVANIHQLNQVVSKIPKKAIKLIKAFWPGPLTLVLQKSPLVPLITTAGFDSVAVRMPSNKIALTLIKHCKFPIAAPSANTSGKPSPTKAKHAYDDLKGKVPLVIDSGSCKHGLESTVINMLSETPMLLRPGSITKEQIEKVIGKVTLFGEEKNNSKTTEKPLSPGMKYTHYSPNAELILVLFGKNFSKKLFELSSGKKTGIISFSKKLNLENEYYFENDLKLYAKNLFSCFRELDEKGAEQIIVEGVKEKGLGLALMNRLRKAATKIV
jgi:L-threonylcarbamoyladenylate synthase